MPVSLEQDVRLSKPKLILPDREIIVIGTSHGQKQQPFPGRSQTEQEMALNTPELAALAVDSQFDFNGPEGKRGLRDALDPKKNDEALTFEAWSMRTAINRRVPLINADIINSIDLLDGISEYEFETVINNIDNPYLRAIFDGEEYARLSNTRQSLRETDSSGNFNLMNGFLVAGLFIADAIRKRKVLSRRGAFTRIAGAFTAGAVGGGMKVGANRFVQPRMVDTQNQIYALIDTVPAQASKDINDLTPRFAEVGEVTAQDKSLESFQRHADFSRFYEINIVFRNAVAAEILSLPLDKIIPGYDVRKMGPAGIANVWGFRHLVVPDGYSVDELIKNPKLRQDRINHSVDYLVSAIRSMPELFANSWIMRPEVLIAQLKGQIRDAGKSVLINPDGSTHTQRFIIPGLEQAIYKY